MTTLDNPIWHSLSTVHASVAEVGPGVRCYPVSIAPLASVENEAEELFSVLDQVLTPNENVWLLLDREPKLPGSISKVSVGLLIQMICPQLQKAQSTNIVELGESDINEMIELTKVFEWESRQLGATRVRSFSARRLELGEHLGVRHGDRLVAMVGERLQTEKFTEISAVCTHRDFRSKGYAKALVSEMCDRILSRGKLPILHVRPDNANALSLYKSLGFIERRQFCRCILKKRAE